MKIKHKYPCKEYLNTQKTPVYIELQGKKFVLPVSYNGNKEDFVNDLFGTKEIEEEYHNKNKKTKYIEIQGNNKEEKYKIAIPLNWAKIQLEQHIINRMMDQAILKYNSSVRIAKMLSKTAQKSSTDSLISLDSNKIDKQVNEIIKFFEEKTRIVVHKINKGGSEIFETGIRNAANYGARGLSMALALPFILGATVSYKNPKISKPLTKIARFILHKNIWKKDLIDKSKSQETAKKINKLADIICDKLTLLIGGITSQVANKSREISQKKIPETQQTLNENKKQIPIIAAALGCLSGGGGGVGGGTSTKDPSTTSITTTSSNTEQTFTPIKYTITDRQSFYDAFDASSPLIHRALLATEWFSGDGYSDNNNPDKNTIGPGLYWFPNINEFKADGTIDIDNINWKNVEWISAKKFMKNHPNFKINYEDAKFVSEQWYKTREGGRIIKTMAKYLQDCELTSNEIAAIASVYYNDEASGRKLCEFVQNNYNNKIACAQFISSLQPKNSSYNEGIQKRHIHEALYFLNHNNYCSKVLDFNVYSGINSYGRFKVISAATYLKPEEYNGFLSELKNEKLGAETDQLIKKMSDFAPESGVNFTTISLREFIRDNAPNSAEELINVKNHTETNNTILFRQFPKEKTKT